MEQSAWDLRIWLARQPCIAIFGLVPYYPYRVSLAILGGTMGPSRSEPIVAATSHRHRLVAAVFLTLCISASSADRARADAGGLSYWLPGTFGSLAAAPGVPGWAYSTIYLHVQEKAQGDKEFVRGGAKLGD